MIFWRDRTVNINLRGTLALVEPPAPGPIMVQVTSRFDGIVVKGVGDMAYTLPDDKTIFVKVEYQDARGHPAAVDGDVTWTTSDEMIANVGVKQGESTEAQIIPGANLGQAQITASADADLGAGVTSVVCTMDVTVVAGSAVIGTITPTGEPQPFPDAPSQPRRR